MSVGHFEALSPRGTPPAVRPHPLAPRPVGLDGRTVVLLRSWAGGSGMEPVLERVALALRRRWPGCRVESMAKATAYSLDEPALWDRIVDGVDAFVYAAAPSASTTHYAVHYAAGLERRGRPGVVLAYETLHHDAVNSVAGCGVPMRWVEVPYPLRQASDASLEAVAARVLDALVAPPGTLERDVAPAAAVPRAPEPAQLAFAGSLEDVQAYFHESGWTDGLPIVPPTGTAVAAMLAGTRCDPDALVVEAMGPEGWRANVRQVAINAVMAGCTPACLPVVLASIEAFALGIPGNPTAFSTPARATSSFSFMQVVNGPIRHAAGMNAGTNALGPGNRANATIGRALRLAIVNLGGGRVGVNLMPVQGNPSAYTFAFAENEEASPWPSLAQDAGFAAQDSVLTLMTGGWSHLGNYLDEDLDRLARDAAVFEYPSGLVVLLSPQRARALAAAGLDKAAVEDSVWRTATVPARRLRSGVFWDTLIEPNIRLGDARSLWPPETLTVPDDAQIPAYPRRAVRAIVVGGEVSPMMQAWKMQNARSVSIDRWR